MGLWVRKWVEVEMVASEVRLQAWVAEMKKLG